MFIVGYFTNFRMHVNHLVVLVIIMGLQVIIYIFNLTNTGIKYGMVYFS